MTPKEFLKQYRDAEKAIRARLDEIEKLQALAERTTQVLREDKVQSSLTGLREEALAALVDMKEEAKASICLLSEVKRQVETAIKSVQDGTLRNLLQYRYINGWNFERISVELNYSYYHVVHELHPNALAEIHLNPPEDI